MNDYLIEDVMQKLGLCPCGMPHETLSYIGKRMEALANHRGSGYSDETYAAMRALFHSDGEYYFFWHVMDALGMTEHGGSVPGWPDEAGYILIDLIRQATAEKSTTEPQP